MHRRKTHQRRTLRGSRILVAVTAIVMLSAAGGPARDAGTQHHAQPLDGACCLRDGSCVSTSAAECVAMHGIFAGHGASCDGVSCAQPGVCCLSDGRCRPESAVAPYGVINCEADGGVYQGDDSSCETIACAQPGACCLADGSCRVESRTAPQGEIRCETDGGTYQGNDTSCDTINCPAPTGACCVEDGCIVVDQAQCEDVLGGRFLGVGVSCDVGCPRDTD